MAHIRDDALEQIQAEMAEYESEISDLTDRIIELEQENAALKAELMRYQADPQFSD